VYVEEPQIPIGSGNQEYTEDESVSGLGRVRRLWLVIVAVLNKIFPLPTNVTDQGGIL
jgi:hypothetical protein